MADYDLVIVGGGVGGSALAVIMARAGKSVLVLERTDQFEDQVRGEWIAPWGVAEVKRLGLYDLLMGAGGHHLSQHVTYDETLDAALAEAEPLALNQFAPGVPGPLCIGHPRHCQVLLDAARAAGAEVLRGVDVRGVRAGDAPQVLYAFAGRAETARARLVVGADGRSSTVRDALGVALHLDRPHHMFGGMLVEGASGWDDRLQAIGTEADFAFLAFPQGQGRVRIYGSYPLQDRARFSGPEGPERFLASFRVKCSPANRHIVEGRPAGPLRSYTNNDAWTDRPFVEGGLLIGDAAGWNDPIVGLGLSITYRDVRLVSDILLSSEDWSPAALQDYAVERCERMRRLRFAASIQSALDAEFGEGPRDRRRRYHERRRADPSLGLHGFAVMVGPEAAPAEAFTPAYRDRVLGEEAAR